MQALRTENDLLSARRDLFATFPKEGNAQLQFLYQERLAQEIVHTEQELLVEKSPRRKAHLHAVRTYGDALTWTCLSRYAIRQLARNTGKPPYLSSQKQSFDLAMACAKAVADQGVPAILADLTNILKVGDLIACEDPDAPTLIECKLSKVKDARFERQGRRGRQMSRMESIERFLLTGRGVIFGEEKEQVTVELAHAQEFSYPTVNQIVLAALHHKATTLLVSEHELYSAARIGEVADSTAEIARWGPRPGEKVAVGNSFDPLIEAWPDVPPPMVWDITPETKWALMEGDVGLTHAVRVEAFLGLQQGRVHIRSVTDVPGHFPWGYEIALGDYTLIASPNMLLDVVYAHETVNSAGARLLELAEKAAALIGECMTDTT